MAQCLNRVVHSDLTLRGLWAVNPAAKRAAGDPNSTSRRAIISTPKDNLIGLFVFLQLEADLAVDSLTAITQLSEKMRI